MNFRSTLALGTLLALTLSLFPARGWCGDEEASTRMKANDQQVAIKMALKDFETRSRLSEQNRRVETAKSEKTVDLSFLKSTDSFRPLETDPSCVAACVRSCDTGSGGGSASCWDKCVKEGWSSDHCASTCGTSTGGGSSSCWDKCTKEGWSSDHCASTCGTGTGGGSEGCWEKCAKEGWSSDHCASSCGTSTGAGSAACWAKCTKEGWSSDHCASTCGTH